MLNRAAQRPVAELKFFKNSFCIIKIPATIGCYAKLIINNTGPITEPCVTPVLNMLIFKSIIDVNLF